MGSMRKTLLGLMTFLMLTPVLACAMAFCPLQANAAEQPPCHQMNGSGDDGPMLVLDCLGVDLFQQDASHDVQPDQSVERVDYAWVDLAVDYSSRSGNVNGIRGPPDRAERPYAPLSLILTTQRFRI